MIQKMRETAKYTGLPLVLLRQIVYEIHKNKQLKDHFAIS